MDAKEYFDCKYNKLENCKNGLKCLGIIKGYLFRINRLPNIFYAIQEFLKKII